MGFHRAIERLYWRWRSGDFSLRTLVSRFMHSRVSSAQYKGIRIWDSRPREEREESETELFVKMVTEALRLIERHDPRRFRRVQRTVKFVILKNLPHRGGRYILSLRACEVNPPRWVVQDSETHWQWRVAKMAVVIVHEAMHGYLFLRRIPYTKRTWVQSERICIREAQRFAQKLSSDRYDFRDLVKPFDPNRWLSGKWQNRWRSWARKNMGTG